MSWEEGIAKLVASLKSAFPLGDLLPQKPPYHSLTLCLIDAVFSIQAKYESVENVVDRYCTKYGVKMRRAGTSLFPPRSKQDSMSDLVGRITSIGSARFAAEVFQNRCLTSPRGGILKAEAVLRTAQAFANHGVEHLQDVPRLRNRPEIEKAFRSVPGQGPGTTFKYFLMEAGCEDLVKPDTMLLRWLKRSLGRAVRPVEAQALVAAAAASLREEFPGITARRLDGLIWKLERESGATSKDPCSRRRRRHPGT